MKMFWAVGFIADQQCLEKFETLSLMTDVKVYFLQANYIFKSSTPAST